MTTRERQEQAQEATPAAEPVVFVSTVQGDGAQAHRIVRVGDWEFLAPGADGTEPFVPAFEAAQRLGFKRQRDINELIERTWSENQRPINRRTVRQWIAGKGAVREEEVSEYLLTEAQLLKLCARARTEPAEAVLDDMIRCYLLARRGLLGPAIAPELVATLRSENQELRAAIADLSSQVQRLAEGSSCALGTRDARREILEPVRLLAQRLVKTDPAISYPRRVSMLHYALRDSARWWRRWADLPRERLALVLADLRARERECSKREQVLSAAKRTAEQARQVPLPFEKREPSKPS